MREAAAFLGQEGVRVEPTLLDINPSHLSARYGLSAVVGDATRIPLATKSFDVISCSLFMHHLEPPQIKQFLSEAVRVARHAVIINDLKRSYLHLLFVKVGLQFFGNRLTKHDGPVSIWRSYTKREMLEMIRQVHAREVEIGDHYLFRMGAILWL
jgi:ubiquinone/menaquinone biosynthesis C-methylase UbiE